MSEKAPGSGGRENEWARSGGVRGPGANHGSRPGFPWTHVRGPVAGITGHVSIFSLGDGMGCIRRNWCLWAQGLETGRNRGIGLSVPRLRHKCPYCGLASGSKTCHHIGVLKAKIGPSLRDARVLGLSPSYEHTPKEKEREIWGPLHYAASDSHLMTSMPQPSSPAFLNHNTPRWPHSLYLSGLSSALGQGLLSL